MSEYKKVMLLIKQLKTSKTLDESKSRTLNQNISLYVSQEWSKVMKSEDFSYIRNKMISEYEFLMN